MWFFYDGQGTRTGLVYSGHFYYYLYNVQGDVVALADSATGGTFNLFSFGTAYDFAAQTMTRIAIKASFALTENILVGTATAVVAGTATHIGTTIARESNKGYANTERKMAK